VFLAGTSNSSPSVEIGVSLLSILMKLKDLIGKLDYTKAEECWKCNKLCDYFNINCFELDQDIAATKIKSIPFIQWYCTDTYVGAEILLYENKSFACTLQQARKSDIEIIFFDKEVTNEVRNFLLSLLKNNNTVSINEDILEEELGDGFNVNDSSQVLNKTCRYLGVKCKIIKTFEYGENIIINYQDKDIEVPLEYITFNFWNMKK